MFEHQLAQLKRNQPSGHGSGVEPLDDGLVPVGLRGGAFHGIGLRCQILRTFGLRELGRGEAEPGALPPIVAPQQRVALRHQFAEAHAGMPLKAAGICDGSPQCDFIAILREDGVDADDVAARQQSGQARGIGGHGKGAAPRAVFDAIHGEARAGGDDSPAAGGVEKLLDGLLAAKFIHGRLTHASHERNLRAGDGDVEHIGRLQLHVARFVAADEQGVEIEIGNHLSRAL